MSAWDTIRYKVCILRKLHHRQLLQILAIASGTGKCLVAIAGPFSVARLVLSSRDFSSVAGLDAMSHTVLPAHLHILDRHKNSARMFVHRLCLL